MPTEDPRAYQIGGNHYKNKPMQPWDIIEAWSLDYWEGNVLKYLLRRKPGTRRSEDLGKALHYANFLLYQRPKGKRAKQLRKVVRALRKCLRRCPTAT